MNCEVEVTEAKGPLGTESGEELTVGRPFVLKCSGEWPEMQAEKLELRLDPKEQRKLKLLQFEKVNGGEARLMVTSYVSGEHQLKAVQLVDPEHSVVLGDLHYTVKSVIDPQNPPKEPYGPMGPVVYGIPLWFWLTLILSLAALVGLVWWRGAIRARRRRWLLEMKLFEKVLSPMSELGKTLRLAQKDLSRGSALVQELDLAYRVYLARLFQIPTLKLSDGQILREIKKQKISLYQDQAMTILKTLQELKKAKLLLGEIPERDLEQLVQLVRRSADHIEKYLAMEKRGSA